MNFKLFKRDHRRKIKWKKIILIFFASLIILFWLTLSYLLWPFRGFFWDLPWMMWFFWERQYLVLLQNNYEKRATWWFISSYAVVKTFFWNVSFEIKDSYDIWDPSPLIEPPYPLNKLLSTDKFYKWWTFRDSNWSPDFNLSAVEASYFYEKWTSNKSSFDWIIALDMEFLKTLIDIYWPQNVSGTIFTADDYFYKLQVLSKNIDLHNIEDLKNRKNFIKPLVSSLFKQIIKNPWKIWDFLESVKNLADEKHIQIFFSNANLQNKIRERWWSWEFKPRAEDYIHVSISNIWWRKSDRYIQNLYYYDVDFSWEDAIWDLKITSKHFWTKSLISDFYQAYFRIYLPKWIEIIEYDADFKDENEVFEDLDSKVISWIVHMQPWEDFEINIKYKLPKIIKSSNYNLEIIPQAWWNWENWNISVKEKTDYLWTWEWFDIFDNVSFFNWIISKNKLFNLENQWDTTAPVVVWQKFISNDLIEVNFSEEVSRDAMKDLWNFEITDLNSKNTETDEIQVKRAYFRENSLYLELSWISYQSWEHYLLNMKNIYDLSWNYSKPSPMSITVVQN